MGLENLQLGSRRRGYDVDAAAFISRSGITDGTQKSAVNRLVLDLKAAAIFTKMYGLYPFVGGSDAAHKENLASASYPLTKVGTITNDANGSKSDGTTGYWHTGTLTSTVVGATGGLTAHSNLVGAAGGCGWLGQANESTNRFSIGRFGSGTQTCYRFGVTTQVAVTEAQSTGCFTVVRRSTTDLEGYKNGASVGTDSTVTAFVDAVYRWHLLGTDTGGGSITTARFGCMAIHQSLTTSEVLALYNAILACQTTLGR